MLGDLAAVVLTAGAVGLDHRLAAGAAAVLAVVMGQRLAGAQPVPRPVVLGLRQMAIGFGVVVVTTIGVLLSPS
ncbi:hypothetical protein [Aquihabitans sp. McL0605]|uniref:hypothetical protein n=1 Tax=Aquihabitans sp. McL0605 TaxID=3415671 RepID=UPI003CE9F810